jgi:hypothetical protein
LTEPARALEAGREVDHGFRLCHARESPERDTKGITVPSGTPLLA